MSKIGWTSLASRQRILGSLSASLLSLAFASQAQAQSYDVEDLIVNGPEENRVNIIILGDGYTSAQQAKMTSDAQGFLDLFFQKWPTEEYGKYFNARLIHVISNESGADNGSAGGNKDTVLGAHFNCGGIDRLLCVDDNKVLSVVADHVDASEIILVVVNDTKYGGAGGVVGTFSTNDAAPDIALHEFAHAYANLADEYDDAYPGFPACGSECPEPNVSTKSDRDTNKWKLWIDASTPLPTTGSDNSVIGAYEGARYLKTGLFRPIPQCQMRMLGRDFCSVCSEALVLQVHETVDPIEREMPPQGSMILDQCQSQKFSLDRLVPTPDTTKVAWYVDGNKLSESSDSLELDASTLTIGSHTLKVEIIDETDFVRSDPSNLLETSRSWTIDVEACAETGGDDTTGSDSESDSDSDSSGDTTDSNTDTGTGDNTQTDTEDPSPDTGDSSGDDSTPGSTDDTNGDDSPDGDDDTQVVTCSCRQGTSSPVHVGWLGLLLVGLSRVCRRSRRSA